MKREENDTLKEAYITPSIESGAIDNEISVVLMSDGPPPRDGLTPRDDV